jgi:NAD(P)-dependent dehydrogenase (short-subunit alcohol dehydrogenase family)
MGNDWTAQDIPNQAGRVAIVTGANSGIGLETARELARQQASVVLACRSRTRAEEAIADIRRDLPDARVEFLCLDLADLEQLREFVSAFRERFDRLDLLINNAGVMIPPESKTKQGFELQFGVNHLAHFALTGQLMDLLLASEDSRVVNVSSIAHRSGKLTFDDLDFQDRGYKPSSAYGQSKLANLLFTLELAARLEAAGSQVIAASAHPGWTQSNLQQHSVLFRLLNPLFGMQPPEGALPTLRAATAPDVQPGEYYGPKRLMEMRGAPVLAATTRAAQSRPDAERLWKISEERTDTSFDFARAGAPA